MTNFEELLDLSKNIITTFKGKILNIKRPYLYFGPVTLQYLPYGGIQLVYDHQLILTTKNGFVASKELSYDGKELTVDEFVKLYPELVNEILPN